MRDKELLAILVVYAIALSIALAVITSQPQTPPTSTPTETAGAVSSTTTSKTEITQTTTTIIVTTTITATTTTTTTAEVAATTATLSTQLQNPVFHRIMVGVAYRALLNTEAQWRSDLRLMKELGFNTIRIFYVAPSNTVLSTPYGLKYNYNKLEEFLRLACSTNFSVVVTIHYELPDWMQERGYVMEDQNGDLLPASFPRVLQPKGQGVYRGFLRENG